MISSVWDVFYDLSKIIFYKLFNHSYVQGVIFGFEGGY